MDTKYVHTQELQNDLAIIKDKMYNLKRFIAYTLFGQKTDCYPNIVELETKARVALEMTGKQAHELVDFMANNAILSILTWDRSKESGLKQRIVCHMDRGLDRFIYVSKRASSRSNSTP